jgi:hypothetical protein
MAVYRSEVRSHRHDGYVASSGRAPCRDVARPLIIAAAVLLDRSEFIIRASKFGGPGLNVRLDRDSLRLGSAREHKSVADPGRPFLRGATKSAKPNLNGAKDVVINYDMVVTRVLRRLGERLDRPVSAPGSICG